MFCGKERTWRLERQLGERQESSTPAREKTAANEGARSPLLGVCAVRKGALQ